MIESFIDVILPESGSTHKPPPLFTFRRIINNFFDVPIYPETIAAVLEDLTHAGFASDGSAAGRAVNFDCGGYVQFSLDISGDEPLVAGLRFRSKGCGYMVAAAEAACRALETAKLSELHGLSRFDEILRSKLGKEPQSRSGCFKSVSDAVRSAFKDYRDRRVEEFTGEKALICTCFGVSEETVVRFIESARPSTVDQVSASCRAGSGCGACRMLIQELIDLMPE